VGYGGNLDFEAMKSRKCDLVLLYGVSGQEKLITSKLEQLDIPYIYIGEYVEEHPLGKAEWVVAMAAICGCRERGEALFNSLAERYNTLRSSITPSTTRPKVMLNLPYRDIWYMPSINSYMVHLIVDAGG
jgi:iron complex transport system substrate-binding protein